VWIKLSWRTKLCTVFVATGIATHAQTFTTLVDFGAGGMGGAAPFGSLVQDTDGSLYGTTSNGLGTIFKITPDGTWTTLHNFGVQPGDLDGGPPLAGLIRARDGNFYGTTHDGGGGGLAGGTVFKMDRDGTLTTLHNFGSVPADGYYPSTKLIQATDGSFYGTTAGGGTNSHGTVFKITSEGSFTTLYSFDGTKSDPSELIQASDGNFYGTTAGLALGTVFKITPGGSLTTLHSFGSDPGDGFRPVGALVQATDGNFYGTTSQGGGQGTAFKQGTVFKMTAGGTVTILYSFNTVDGMNPQSALIQARDGNLYGTTYGDGNSHLGTVFQITPGGQLTTLHSFGRTDGAYPRAALIQASDGNFYGTTSGAAGGGGGTVFRLSVASTTPTAPSITSGGIVPVYSASTTIQPGEWLSIYGTNLASGTATWKGDFPTSLGGTTVTINGKAAYLWFVSPNQINLQAPDDTSAGTVPVVVTTVAGSSTSFVTLAQFGPAFSLLDARHVAGIILRSNGAGAYGGGAYDILGPTGTSLGYPTVAAKAGDTIELFGVGFGPTSPSVPAGQAFSGSAATSNRVIVGINNVGVIPGFAGLSSAGLYQINLTVPPGIGTGDVPLLASVVGVLTPSSVVISLQ
jgi:uncharacterized protein (TIGR03437 family)